MIRAQTGLLDAIPHIVWWLRADGQLIYTNPAWHQYASDIPTGWLGLTRFVHPDDLGKLAESGSEVRLRGHDGEYGWFRIAITALSADDQLYTCTDIHEAVGLRKALHESEDHHRFTLDALPFVLWDASSDGKLVDFSDKWLEMTGRTRKQAQRIGWTDIPHPEDFPRMLSTWARCLQNGEPMDIEHRIRVADGTIHWMRSRATPRRNEKGEIARWYGITEDIQGRKFAEELLPETTDAVRAFIAYLDDRLVYRFCNAAYAEFFGRTREDIIGRFIGEIVGAEVFSVTEPYLRRALAGEEVSYSVWLEFPASGRRFFSAVYRPRLGIGGKVEGIYSMVVDETEQRLAMEALDQSQERLRVLLDTVSVGVAEVHPASRSFVSVNSALCNLLGYSAEELIGKTPWDFCHPDDMQVGVTEMTEFGDGRRERGTWERRYIRKDGKVVTLLVGVTKLDPLGNGPITNLGVLTDITEQRAREANLRFLSDLTESTREIRDPAEFMTITLRMLGEYLVVSRSAYASVDDVAGEFTVFGDWSLEAPSIVGTYGVESFGSTIPSQQGAGQTSVVDDIGELDPADGRVAFQDLGVRGLICCPLVKEGLIVAMLAVHNSTPRQWEPAEVELVEMVAERSWSALEHVRAERALAESEQELRTLNTDLDRRVKERTLELETANQQLQGFTYHVSHDLRAPLRAIAATSRMLQEDYGKDLAEAANVLVARQAEAANKMARLIDDLLKLSRLAREEIVRTPLDLTQLANEAFQDAIEQHANSGVQAVVQVGLVAEADSRLFKLAISNLIENAVKYSPSGGTIRVGVNDDMYFVSDEGIGMEPQYLQKIFEPFQRLHRDEQFRGTGIGLANVKQVIERHGGRVWAESQPGEGATFYFTIGRA